MGPRPLYSFNSFSADTVFRRQNQTSVDGPLPERVKVYNHQLWKYDQ